MDQIISLENIKKHIQSLENRIEMLWKDLFPRKNEVEGYLIFFTIEKSLLLVKENDRYWKTKWFNNNENIYKSPVKSLNEIFLAK